MPISHKQARTIAKSAPILTPSAISTSAEPDCEESARLPCLATGTPQPATTRALAVEMLKLPEPSPPVPTVSIVPGGASIASALALMIRAAPVISSTVSPRTRSPIRKAPICDGVASPLMMISKAASASLSLRRRPAATSASSGFRSLTGTLIAFHRGRRCTTSPFTLWRSAREGGAGYISVGNRREIGARAVPRRRDRPLDLHRRPRGRGRRVNSAVCPGSDLTSGCGSAPQLLECAREFIRPYSRLVAARVTRAATLFLLHKAAAEHRAAF